MEFRPQQKNSYINACERESLHCFVGHPFSFAILKNFVAQQTQRKHEVQRIADQ